MATKTKDDPLGMRDQYGASPIDALLNGLRGCENEWRRATESVHRESEVYLRVLQMQRETYAALTEYRAWLQEHGIVLPSEP